MEFCVAPARDLIDLPDDEIVRRVKANLDATFPDAAPQARIVKSEPPAHKVRTYIRKYGDQIKGFGWTPEEFSRRYPHAIRVRNLRWH